MPLDEDNTDNSISAAAAAAVAATAATMLKEDPALSAKRQRRFGPVSTTSEEEYDIVSLPEGIEEQYGFKINPVILFSLKASNFFFSNIFYMYVCIASR